MADLNSIGGFNPLGNLPPQLPAADLKADEGGMAQVADSFTKSGKVRHELEKSIMKTLNEEPSRDTKMLGGTRILPDNYGRVKNLAFQLSSYVGGSMRDEVLNAYKTVFQNMEPDTKFTLVVESDRDKKDIEKVIKDNKLPNPERFQFIQPDNLSLTVWARDQMLGMYFPNDPSKTALLNQTTFHSWHNEDTLVPPYIAAQNPSIVLDQEKRIVTDGGEVVSAKDETFVGNFSIQETAQKLKSLGDQDPAFSKMIKGYVEKKTGKVVIPSDLENPFPYKFIPKTTTPEMHERPYTMVPNPDYQKPILQANEVEEGDMWIKAAKDLFTKEFGQKIFVMGEDDPSTPQVEGPANDHLDMAITPIDDKTVIVGDPSLAKRALEQMTPERRTEVLGQMSKIFGKKVTMADLRGNREYPNQQHDFDTYAKSLEKEGYRTIRLPYAEPGWSNPNITYTNCLQEQFTKDDGTKVKRIFLPIYDIPELDKFAVDTYKKEGFEVFTMPMPNLATRKGALRCISQWLDRSH